MRSHRDREAAGRRPRLGGAGTAWIAILLSVLPGCAYLPGELGLQSMDEDKRLGREGAAQVVAGMGIADAPKLTDLVAAVGNRLAGSYPGRRFEYTFRIADEADANAFALPGGTVFVTRGLLALTDGEDELAGVIAHEIIHVERRHTAQQLAKERVPALLSLPGKVVGHVLSRNVGTLISSPFEVLGAAGLARYSRAHEYEADEIGVQVAGAAGYDPLSLPRFLGRLELEGELTTGQKHRFNFLDTHPLTPDRVTRLNDRSRGIERAQRPPVVSGAGSWDRMLDGLTIGPDPSHGIFRSQAFLHPDLDLYMEFPPGWETTNTAQAAGAVAPDKTAAVLIQPPRKGTDPEAAARECAKDMESEFGLRPETSRALELNGLPAYHLAYWDRTDRVPIYLHFLWISYRGAIYPLLGMGPERDREALAKTALSFRSLTAEEKKSMTVLRLRIAEAREGEDLAALGQRVSNRWDEKTTAVKNGLDRGKPLAAGQPIKVALEEPYGHR